MRVKVLKVFRDKYSGRYYKENEIITVSKERFDEISKVGKLVEKIDEPKKAKNTAE